MIRKVGQEAALRSIAKGSGLRPLLSKESGQIIRQIILAIVIVVILGLLVVEFGPQVWYRFSTKNDAEDVANKAAFEYKLYNSEAKAVEAAANSLNFQGYSDEEIRASKVIFMPVDSSTKTKVEVTVVKFANTLITRHIGFLKKLSRISSSAEADVSTASTR